MNIISILYYKLKLKRNDEKEYLFFKKLNNG